MTLAEKLTPKTVVAYHSALLAHVDADLLTMSDVNQAIDAMETITSLTGIGGIAGKLFELLEKFEIIDPMEFLSTTAITIPIPIGRANRTMIYVPWEPSDTSKFSLATQVEILSHEAAHVIRAKGGLAWLSKYLLSFAVRTREERKAFQTSLELYFLLHDQVPPVSLIIEDLTRYFLRPTDEKVLIAGLNAIVPAIREGDRSTPIGKWAAEWFKKRI